MTESWTIARVLQWTTQDLRGRGFPNPRLDAELLIAHALGLRRIELYTRHDQPMIPAELGAVRELVARRRRHEPVAYIRGEREFYGRVFKVDARVLVPRPETELVVECALERLGASPADGTRVLDIGAGSGAIAVTLAAERPAVRVVAVDVSADAADVARENARALGVADRVDVRVGDAFAPVAGERFALVVSNPPYIPTLEVDQLMPDVREFEPRLALDGGPDGEGVIARILAAAREFLLPSGPREGGPAGAGGAHETGPAVVMEVGAGQAGSVGARALAAGWASWSARRDLAGIERVVVLIP